MLMADMSESNGGATLRPARIELGDHYKDAVFARYKDAGSLKKAEDPVPSLSEMLRMSA